MPTDETTPLYEIPARPEEHTKEFAVGTLETTYVPSRLKSEYEVPVKITVDPTEKK
jgi:hypothetical protein